ncbi:MAG: type III secretion inner membrane ring lipoprotein SctJ [Planctomycetaceae bacterium]|nr:type III secretion inner membrane ring lipoprotein SctJ [Planctomycetaceae bacterium]
MQLFADLSEGAANEILAVLQEQGIACTKRPGAEGTYMVMVDEMDFQRSMRLLERLNLPRQSYDSMGTVFAKSGIVSTPTEEKARMVYALSQELTQTFTRIDGVLEARVHIVMRNVSDLGQEISPASAAIFLKVNEAADSDGVLVANRVNDIRSLTMNAVPDLQGERVQVVIFPTEAPIPRGDSQAMRSRREHELRIYIIGAVTLVALLVVCGIGYFIFMRKRAPKKTPPPPPPSDDAAEAQA